MILLRHRRHKLPIMVFENKDEYKTQGALATPRKFNHCSERIQMSSGPFERLNVFSKHWFDSCQKTINRKSLTTNKNNVKVIN